MTCRVTTAPQAHRALRNVVDNLIICRSVASPSPMRCANSCCCQSARNRHLVARCISLCRSFFVLGVGSPISERTHVDTVSCLVANFPREVVSIVRRMSLPTTHFVGADCYCDGAFLANICFHGAASGLAHNDVHAGVALATQSVGKLLQSCMILRIGGVGGRGCNVSDGCNNLLRTGRVAANKCSSWIGAI